MIFLRVPAALSYRDLVARAVSTACKVATGQEGSSTEVSAESVSELVSAVGEAFNNAVIHAYAGGPGQVAVEIEASGSLIEVTVIDEGQTFDLAAVPPPDLASLPESGMGLYIIRSFVDELSYTPGPPNVLRMRKRL